MLSTFLLLFSGVQGWSWWGLDKGLLPFIKQKGMQAIFFFEPIFMDSGLEIARS